MHCYKLTIPVVYGQPFHRTLSFDYGILTHGTMTLILDDDKRVVMHPGDVIVQRGTIHAWFNEGTEWTRMHFILLREWYSLTLYGVTQC